MSVTVPPRSTDTQDDRGLERRVADLEALIEEARRRARRRRQRYAVAALAVGGAGAGLFIGFGGHGGGTAGTAASAHTAGSPGAAAKSQPPPLGVLPGGRFFFVDGFAFDPRNPRVVYVLLSGRLVKTTDGGAHWRVTGGGWTGGNEALAADPRHPGTLYVGTSTGVVKTVNGGRSWRRSNRGLLPPASDPPDFRHEVKGRVIALAVDPADSNVVYAGSDRISKSTDGGRSWTTVFPARPVQYRDSVSALAIAPTRPETIYAITSFSVDGPTSIETSTDAGATWHASNVVRGLQSGALGFATAVAVDPRRPATVYAALGANLVKTTDAGTTWKPIANGLPIAADLARGGCHCNGGVNTLVVDPRSGAVYAALTEGGVFRSTDGGRRWARTSRTGPLYGYYTVAVDPARPATIYAAAQTENATGSMLFRSTDGGRTWVDAP